MIVVSFSTKNEVIGRLRMAGLTMKQFAEEEGFEPDTVRKVVRRYAGTGKVPRGAVARKILRKLGERMEEKRSAVGGRKCESPGETKRTAEGMDSHGSRRRQ